MLWSLGLYVPVCPSQGLTIIIIIIIIVVVIIIIVLM
jgi:hypothetical protein